MKKYYIYILTAVLPILWGACNNGDDIDTKHSIFSTEPMEHNGFDEWLLANYTYPYNVDFKYRMQDIESDHKYNLVPADYDKSVALAKIIKHVWMEAYTELAGPAFLRSYVPKTFHLIGSPAYDSSGTKVLGTAEGGKKITLYEVNSLDFENVDIEVLNEYYFKTMHHEFAHILHQTKNYSTDFNTISAGKYTGPGWMNITDQEARQMGFVSNYASTETQEDFVETIAIYVTYTKAQWQNILNEAGEAGAAIILQKFEMVKEYLAESWGIDIDMLHNIVQEREENIGDLDLGTL